MDETTLVLNFNEELASVSGLTNSAFTVKKTPSGGSEEEQALSGTPTVSGETVTLTLSSPVIASDRGTVKVSYTAPTESGAKLRDVAGNDVVNFMDLRVLNLRGGICSRTEVVRDVILDRIDRTEFCDEVTSDDFRTIVSLDLSRMNITELQSGDFSGLGVLSILQLNNNSLTSLPQDLFDGLTNIVLLNLHNNSLTSLHQDLFESPTRLTSLNLQNNSLMSLHEDLFDGLTRLVLLNLQNNSLMSLHPDLFDDVEGNPFNVSLGGNSLACVPAKILSQENIIINPSSLGVACPDPSVTLSSNPQTIGEEDGATEVTVTVTLNVVQATATPVTVSVGSGTATSGTDFAAVSDFTISIPANTLSATGTFTLTPTSDTVDEPDETVIITGTSTVEDVTVTETRLTITDDDATPTVTLNLSPTSIPENAGSTSVTATLNHPSSEETTITISVAPTSPATASDYTLSGSILTITAGATESTETVTITAEDNDVIAPVKMVTVQGIASNTQGINSPTDVELTIIDDDLELMVTLNLSPTTISENGASASVTATLNRVSSEATTITISVAPTSPATESDYTLSGSTLTIAAGETESTGEVTITSVDNLVDAPDKTVQVQGVATNVRGVTSPAAVQLTITDDDDAPTITLMLDPNAISEDGGRSTVTATLDHPSSAVTTLTISALPDSPATAGDYMLSEDLELTIAAGETASTGTVTITAVDNDVDAPDKTVQVQGTATNAQGITDPEHVELTITDDEEVNPVVSLILTPASIGENDGQTTVTATIEPPSSAVTTIVVSVLPDAPATASDYLLSGNPTLTIAAGDTESTGQVTITAVDNDASAPDKTVQVQGTATNPQGVTGPAAVELTITDDEAPPTVTLMLDPSTIHENGGRTTVTAMLSHPSGAMTTVVISTLVNPPAMASDLMLSQNTILTIAVGETASTGLVTITAVDNAVDAPDKTVQVQGTATNAQGITGPEDVELTISDDEKVPTVTLNLASASIGEDGESTTVTALLNHPSSEETTIMVLIVPDPPATALDYQLSDTQTLTIAAGETESTGRVTITAIDNKVDAPDKTLQVQGIATNAQGVTDPADVTLTITDDDDTTTSAQVPTELPAVFSLRGNYPNPFNPSTRIQFDLPERAQVTLQVIDILGRKVIEYPAQAFDAGANRTIELNANQLVPGTYLYRMIAIGSETKYQKTGRMTLMK